MGLIDSIEKRINWKTILLLYLFTRIFIVVVLHADWNDESMLCYNVDCKTRWHNVESVVNGLNPYQVWRGLGGYDAGIADQSCWLPFFFILTSIFTFFWKSIWAMRLVFFLFDFINLFLIYKLARYKNTSSILYILAPSIFRGLLFVEDEIFVTFLLASIYFYTKHRYVFSTIMLALSFNHKIFSIILLPILITQIPKTSRNRLLRYGGIFALTTLFWHIFYFPDWYMFYEFRLFHYTITSMAGFGIWSLLPRTFYPVFMVVGTVLFYAYTRFKRINLRSSYLMWTVFFISTYPKFSMDHLILVVPLFLIWTEWDYVDSIFWVFLSLVVCIDFLSLPTISLVAPEHAGILNILVLIWINLLCVVRSGYRY